MLLKKMIKPVIKIFSLYFLSDFKTRQQQKMEWVIYYGNESNFLKQLKQIIKLVWSSSFNSLIGCWF